MENYSDYDFIYKIVLVGDTSVGKTNIFSKYLNDKFEKNSQKTIGGVFGSKTIEIKKKKIKIQIWDITGQEIYTEIAKPDLLWLTVRLIHTMYRCRLTDTLPSKNESL